MEYVGTATAAEWLGCSKATVSRYCREGKFPNAEQDDKGHPWRIPVPEVEKMAAERGIKLKK